MKTFKITVTEDEMRALIRFHSERMIVDDQKIETSERIHNLTKRLNKDTPEIENGFKLEPQVEAAKEEQPTSW